MGKNNLVQKPANVGWSTSSEDSLLCDLGFVSTLSLGLKFPILREQRVGPDDFRGLSIV